MRINVKREGHLSHTGDYQEKMKSAAKAAVILISFALPIFCCGCENNPRTRSEAATQMNAALKSRDYDGAVSIGESWLKSNPSDGSVLKLVATTYLIRAGEDTQSRAEWLRLASQFAKRAIESSKSNYLDEVESAAILEKIADMDATHRCSLYGDSLSVLKDQLGAMAGKASYEVRPGTWMPIGRLRKYAEELQSRITGKVVSCHGTGGADSPPPSH